MNLSEGALNKVVGRPFLIIFSALFSLIYTVIDILNPITALVFGFNSIGQGDMLGTIISLLQTLLSPGLLLKSGLWGILGMIIISLIVSPFLSGYFFILDNTLKGIQKQKSEFLNGIKVYFKSLLRVNLTIFLLFVVFTLFLCVITVPALFTTWSWRAGRTELFAMAILLNIITAIVLLFAVMFFQLYATYWYASVYNHKEKSFLTGKNIVDKNFWILTGRWLIIDIILVIFEVLFIFFRYKITLSSNESTIFTAVLFAGEFTFTAAFFTWVTTFTFASFDKIK